MNKNQPQFTFWDIFLLSLALIFTVLVFRVCLYHLVDPVTMGKNLLALSISFSITIFAFQYRPLRKTKVFLAWSVLSLMLLSMFFWLYNDAIFNYLDKNNMGPYNYANGLKVPAILLIVFWVFRKLSNKYYGTELILPSKNFSRFDYSENREYNFMDYAWMTISLIIIVVGHFY